MAATAVFAQAVRPAARRGLARIVRSSAPGAAVEQAQVELQARRLHGGPLRSPAAEIIGEDVAGAGSHVQIVADAGDSEPAGAEVAWVNTAGW